MKDQYKALRDIERLEDLRLRRKEDPDFEFSEEDNAAYLASFENHTYVPLSKDGKEHPRVITLGGDHTVVLPILRSIYSAYGKISVIHFDSHLDTWKPVYGGFSPFRLIWLVSSSSFSVFGGAPSDQAAINHGTYFYWASQEGLIRNGSSIVSIGQNILK